MNKIKTNKRTIFPGVGECNLCGDRWFAKLVDKLRDGDEKHKVYRCLSCGHVQLLPRPSVNDDKKYYDKDSQEKAIRPKVILEEQRENFKYDVLRRANFIAGRFSKNKEILDVGSGYGFFLEEMSKRGYKIKGIEISKERRKLARTITDVPIFDVNLNEILVNFHSIQVFNLSKYFYFMRKL
jgi:SAM-dependent methyltransferase